MNTSLASAEPHSSEKRPAQGHWLNTGMRDKLTRSADEIAVLLAMSLPWSTSATSILIGLWLLVALPTLDVRSIRDNLKIPAGGLPVLLWLLGMAGLTWSDAAWPERLDALSGFHKLLVIPILIVYFRRSNAGFHVLLGFLAACVALLAVSWAAFFAQALRWPLPFSAIPVKDYISQSAMFTVCILVLLQLCLNSWTHDRRWLATGLAALAVLFLANILYVATSRTSLFVLPLLLALFCFTRSGWRIALGMMVTVAILAAITWPSASQFRGRTVDLYREIVGFRSDAPSTSAGERIVFWKKSIEIVSSAPLAGHGTGSIRDSFQRLAGPTGMDALVTNNPHMQTLAFAMQIGLVGVLVLWAMWLSHLWVTIGRSIAAVVGSTIVLQNILGSLFNSHLFDFTHGWLYVAGVGIAAGVCNRERSTGTDTR